MPGQQGATPLRDKVKVNSPDCIQSKVWREHVRAIVGKAETTFQNVD